MNGETDVADEELDALRRENERLRAEIQSVARANVHAAEQMVEMSLRRQKELERQNGEIQHALERSEEASRQKTMFVATVSHELRTPLNGILGLAELLLEDEADAGRRERLRMLRRSGESLLETVNDILDFAKLDVGGLVVEMRPFDARRTVEAVVELQRASHREKGLELRLDVDASLPGRIEGDERRVRQVLTHLVGNAVKFTPSGRVDVSVRRDGDVMRYAVRDTGCGIDAPTLSRLFEPFVMGDEGSTRRHGGTGLGLAICRRLVRLMGGELTVESAPSRGSTFSFFLPIVEVEDEADAKAANDAARDSGEVGAGLKVLVVEDNRVNALVAAAFLRRSGCEVDEAQDGRAGVEAARRNAYDVIFMDCQMPVMDGYEAAERIRAHERERGGPRANVVALTAHATAVDRDRCLAAGMDAYLTKPICRQDLQRVLAFAPRRRPAAAIPTDV